MRTRLSSLLVASERGKIRRRRSEIAVEMADHADDSLTERAIEVLRQVAAGNANKIIADKPEISEETVKAHMRKILSKLGANDRTHAVAMALRRGIIEIYANSGPFLRLVGLAVAALEVDRCFPSHREVVPIELLVWFSKELHESPPCCPHGSNSYVLHAICENDYMIAH